MITIPLLIIPVIAGYLFADRFIPTRYVVKRSEGHALYFRSSFYGIILFFISLLIFSIYICLKFHDLPFITCLTCSASLIFQNEIAANKSLGIIFILTLPLGLIGANIFNMVIIRFFKNVALLKYVVRDNELELFLLQAITEYKQVSVTMSNDKVYIGWVTSTPDPEEVRKEIKLLPVFSGYRNKDDKEMIITNDYSEIYDQFLHYQNSNEQVTNELLEKYNPNNFGIILPCDKIDSLVFFDLSIYDYLKKQTHGEVKKKSSLKKAKKSKN